MKKARSILTGLLIVSLLVSACTPAEVSKSVPEQEASDKEESGSQADGETSSAASIPQDKEDIEPESTETPVTPENETDDGQNNQEETRTNIPVHSPIFTDQSQCTDVDKVVFTVSPIPLEAINAVEPLGELTGIVAGHITPGDHAGFQYAAGPDFPAYDLRALADGYIVRVERHTYTPPDGYPANIKNYHVYFEHSCTFFTGYIHVTEFAPEILAADDELQEVDAALITRDQYVYPRIPVKAGQIIGKVQGSSLLGMLTVDMSVTHTSYVTPSIYDGEPWKLHAVAPYNYFSEPIRERLMEKNPRTAEPRGGKYDYDVDGRLAGNWFLEGSGGYPGNSDTVSGTCGNMVCPYWTGHLAFVYDFMDPSQVRISIGYDAIEYPQGPYGIKGNAPDPTDVSVESGLVVYELVALEDITAESGFVTMGKPLVTRNDESAVLGVFLVQMIDDQTIKMEVFPNKTAAQVTGFTDAAHTYLR